MQIHFHEMLPKKGKKETERAHGILVKLISLVTIKCFGPHISQKLYSAIKLCKVKLKC